LFFLILLVDITFRPPLLNLGLLGGGGVFFSWGRGGGGGVKVSVELIPGLTVAPSLCLRDGISEILSGVHHTREIEKGC